uniref:Uncharacterized protein n=1 Tax=Lactuca sativa TaxID=4236 RepID=A0A9R1VRK7_LACSA|nr:hypothetical protein LSAT_V11C400172520 [Lactuca sativa]
MFYIVSGGSCRSKRRAVSETKRVDELEEEKSSENGSSRSTRRRLNETKKDKESLVDESEEEENNENGTYVLNIRFSSSIFLSYNTSEGSSVLRIRHDEAERVNEIWIDDSEEETDNENGTFS